ncbi:MAG: hemerythrin domain-containing protein [Candidatus Scalindua sp.]
MSALIEELKKDHSEIVDALNEVKELGILSKEGQSKLMSAKERFLTHLKKEDEQLYPVLRKKAENNKQLESALDLCAIDMENVSRIVLEFFDKYYGGVIDEDFPREFERFFAAFSKRIKDEEDILYDEYDKINQQ